jgi:serine/threonine protein kinase
MSPEALYGEINPKNDIWSVGIIYYNYIFDRFPFNVSDKSIVYKKIINDEIDYSFKKKNIYENDVLLIKKMLEKDSNKRISAFEALNDPIFKNIKYGEEQNKLIEKFFSIDTINNIKKYVNSSILKKTFLYTYILFNQNELKNYYTKMFIALDNYFNKNQGFLKIELIFNEFLKKNLIKEEDKWTFLNIDLNNYNKFKSLNLNNLNDLKTNKIKIKDWGNIEYNIFLSFFVINEIKKENENFEKNFFFIFNLFCDVEKNIEDEDQSFDSINLDDYILIINKNSFYNFLLKNGLSFKDANFCIDEFFDKYNKLNYLTFKSCICDEN